MTQIPSRNSNRKCVLRNRRIHVCGVRLPFFALTVTTIAAFSYAPILLADTSSNRVSVVAADQVTRLDVLPKLIRIGGSNRQQQVLITAIDRKGNKSDVTHHCVMKVADHSIAKIAQASLLALHDGRTHLTVQFGDVTTRVPIVVEHIASHPPVDFRNDIVPLFSKLGCNSGGCHGKQSGQNGFRLSVFGFDARADYLALAHEARGRRVFAGSPESSLLIRKATGLEAHGGGRRTDGNSIDALIFAEWIRQGCKWGEADAPQIRSITVQPSDRVLAMRANQQLLVTATYSDGQTRDVTSAATYTCSAELVAEVDQSGLITTGSIPGESIVTINYMEQVAGVHIVVPRPGAPNPYPEIPTNNHIDKLVWAKLQRMGIVPSDICNDATFLRRLYLDVIGTLPTAPEVDTFLLDKAANKRDAAIERVFSRRTELADYWSSKWADILLVDREKLGERGAYEFHRWLRTQFFENRAYDQWVRELLTATGNSGKQGAVNFFRAARTPEDLTTTVSQAFLGIRLECARCHHHPFDKWGQADFFGMAGFFNGLKSKSIGPGRELIYHGGHQPMKATWSDDLVVTRPPGGKHFARITGDPRVALASWLTRSDNPYFGRLAANRLWKHFLGRGLTEPEDDFRSTSPATNEELLQFLTDKFVSGGFDLQSLMKMIVKSRVYQLTSVPNQTNFDDHQNYSHHFAKRLPPVVLLDAISTVTGAPEHFPGMPLGTRSIQLWDNRMPSYFLDTFGRSKRTSPCECGSSKDPTMAQTLHLMNAPEIDVKITHVDGRVSRLLKSKATDAQIVRQLCLIALGRPPGEKETKIARQLFQQQSRREATEDLMWTLLNSYDFLFIN